MVVMMYRALEMYCIMWQSSSRQKSRLELKGWTLAYDNDVYFIIGILRIQTLQKVT